jgi:syndecan 4
MYTLFQVKQLVPQAPTGSYEMSDVCNVPASFGFSKTFAHCDMDTEGGKWLVIQRRINGSMDFYRNWTDYVYGFGDLDGEFWYGLEKIHCLTTREDVELRIEISNGTTPSLVWTYQLFRVQGAETNYRLTIGQGTGVGGTHDAMAYHNGRPFSTPDRDNDPVSTHCAVILEGAWWYKSCHHSNLNGKFGWHGTNRLNWYLVHYTNVAMKIRPKRCSSEETTC